MFAIKARGENEYYVVGMDSIGYVMDYTTPDPKEASLFETKAAALDVQHDLGDYWSEQSVVVGGL